jgi:plastocyanin
MRTTVPTIVSVTCFMLVTACGGDAEPAAPCADPDPANSVALADFEFQPACIGVASGSTIALENTGAAPHTFTMDGTGVDVDLPAGGSGQASLEGIEIGEYALTCTYHPQMTGTVVVG